MKNELKDRVEMMEMEVPQERKKVDRSRICSSLPKMTHLLLSTEERNKKIKTLKSEGNEMKSDLARRP